jgi:GT2 family glycosyltransferase
MLGAAGGRPDVRFRPPARLSIGDWPTIPTPHPAMMVRRAVYERMGLFRTDLRLAGDYEFLLRAFLSGERFEYVARPLAAVSRGGLSDRQADRYRAETRRTIAAYGLGPFIRLRHWLYVAKWWAVYAAERSGAGWIALTAYRASKSLLRARGERRP